MATQTLSLQHHTYRSFTVPTCPHLHYITVTSEAIRWLLSSLGIRTTFCPINTLLQLIVSPKIHFPNKKVQLWFHVSSALTYRLIGQIGKTLWSELLSWHRNEKGQFSKLPSQQGWNAADALTRCSGLLQGKRRPENLVKTLALFQPLLWSWYWRTTPFSGKTLAQGIMEYQLKSTT